MSERRISFYECSDGYLIHDVDHHTIILYKNNEIEHIKSNKTVREVLDAL